MPKSDMPGDLILLKNLCEKYELRGVFEEVQARKHSSVKSECGAGSCSNDCTMMCAECYACPPDCTLSA